MIHSQQNGLRINLNKPAPTGNNTFVDFDQWFMITYKQSAANKIRSNSCLRSLLPEIKGDRTLLVARQRVA